MRTLVLIDFDGTITTKDSFRAFIRFRFKGLNYACFLLRIAPSILLYYSGLIREKKLKEILLGKAAKGRTEAELHQLGKEFIGYLDKEKVIKPEFMRILQQHQREGAELVVVSASPDLWIKPFAEMHGLQYLCTRLEFDQLRVFTGRISGNNCKGAEKKRRILEQYIPHDFGKIIAYGDSEGDREMMELATERHWVGQKKQTIRQ